MSMLPDLLITGRADDDGTLDLAEASASDARAAEVLALRLDFEEHLLAVAAGMRDALALDEFADAPPLLSVAFADPEGVSSTWRSALVLRASLEFADGTRVDAEGGRYGQAGRIAWDAACPADEPEGAYRAAAVHGRVASRPGTATTALSRGSAVVARDVLRRVLPEAVEYADRCRARLAEHRRDAAARRETSERLAAVGVAYDGRRYGATYQGRRFEGAELVRDASGGLVEVRVRTSAWLSAEAAERLLPELARVMADVADESRRSLSTR